MATQTQFMDHEYLLMNRFPGMVNEEGYTLEQGLLSVGEGWAKLVKCAFVFKPFDIKITQVKEKFGGLRIYFHPNTYDYETLIGALESISYAMCERCGEHGKISTEKHWMKTLCDKHAEMRHTPLGSTETGDATQAAAK